MREAYLQNSCFERFLVFQAKSKANASFNSICYRASLRAFLRFKVWRGTICYIGFYLLFSNPVLVLNLYGACSVLVRSPRFEHPCLIYANLCYAAAFVRPVAGYGRNAPSVVVSYQTPECFGHKCL